MKLKVLITGSNGMLGVDLCQELRKEHELIGVDVIASPALRHCEEAFRPTKPFDPSTKAQGRSRAKPRDDKSSGLRPEQGRRTKQSHKCDVTNKREILQVVKNMRPDIVIHTAAMTDVDGCEVDQKKAYKINAEGARNVALACKAVDAALIYLSTDFVFDGKKKNPYKETDKTDPLSVYADSKLKGEAAAKRILKKYFILRTGWLYGKHGKNFVDTILKKAKTEKALKVVDDQTGSPTYTKDIAKAIHVLISVIASPEVILRHCEGTKCQKQSQKIEYGVYHISNSGSVSWFDYAKEILKLAGSQTKVLPISSKELDRPAKRPRMSVLDNSKFIKFPGHKMRNWQEALKEYMTPSLRGHEVPEAISQAKRG
ncbi:MAG: dTDP-4-dehydrorhamnose reductase [Candidatus Omnitrophica bacterium]|nr:dTDP-4-dehydrorhamnose reductase [Candidatus Omnitrophota bacterium]